MSSEFVPEVELDEPPPPPPPVEVDQDDIDEDAEPESKIPKLGAKREKSPAGPRETKAMNELRNNTDAALKEWMESLSPNGGVKVRVIRTSPKVWKGLNVGGSLMTYDHYIDEEWIREHHGGGNFMLEVKKPRTNGAGWQIAGSRAIQIAGDPRTDDVFRDAGAAAPAAAPAAADNGMAKLAVGVLQSELAAARSHAVPAGMDPVMIQAIMGPLQAQITSLGAMLRDSQAQLALAQQQQSKPPERDEFREKMMSAMIDGDSARMVSMRTQHESELRQVKEGAIQNEARLRDSFERDKQMIIMAHERELNALRSAYDMKVASQETMNATNKALLDGEIRRLQADLTEAKAELAALRLKKDKTILEQAQEFASIKEAIGEITGEDKEEKSVIAQVVEAAGAFPAVQNALGKLTGEGQPAPAQQPQQQVMMQPVARRPQSQLLTGPDGNLYRQMPDGSVQLVRRRAPAAQSQQEGQPEAPPIPAIPPATVKIATDFLETAFRNGQDPAEVATSVRSMVPTDVLTAIKQLGIDGFFEKVARLDGTSPLASQAGRNWSRKLGKALVGE